MQKEDIVQNEQQQTTKISPKAALKTMFFANSGGYSSKRVAGLLGWLVALGVFIAAFIFQKDVPGFGDMILVASTSLLGLDTFKGIFTKST